MVFLDLLFLFHTDLKVKKQGESLAIVQSASYSTVKKYLNKTSNFEEMDIYDYSEIIETTIVLILIEYSMTEKLEEVLSKKFKRLNENDIRIYSKMTGRNDALALISEFSG